MCLLWFNCCFLWSVHLRSLWWRTIWTTGNIPCPPPWSGTATLSLTETGHPAPRKIRLSLNTDIVHSSKEKQQDVLPSLPYQSRHPQGHYSWLWKCAACLKEGDVRAHVAQKWFRADGEVDREHAQGRGAHPVGLGGVSRVHQGMAKI